MWMQVWIAIAAVLAVVTGSQYESAPQQETKDEWVCPPCGVDCHDEVFAEPGLCPHPDCQMELIRKKSQRNVAIVLWPGVELLDFAGPGEVFASTRGEDGESFHVFTMSSSKDPITSQGFVKIHPEHDVTDCPEPDIIVLPGGGVSGARRDDELVAWLESRIGKTEVFLSVCTGAFLLGDLGLLDGHAATTHHSALDSLEQSYPEVQVLRDRRYIDLGNVITSAGVSAGIDSSLYLVERLLGDDTARKTARYMEYDWQPQKHQAHDQR